MRIRVVLVVVAVLVAVVTPAVAHEPTARRQVPAEISPALRVLAAWDTARSQAWADGDAAGLGELYAPGAAAGRADVALLRRYLARGLVVVGMHRQRLVTQVQRAGPRRVVVRVTDRLVGAVAVSTRSRTPLPASAPRSWRLDLRQMAGRWLMVSVRPTGPP